MIQYREGKHTLPASKQTVLFFGSSFGSPFGSRVTSSTRYRSRPTSFLCRFAHREKNLTSSTPRSCQSSSPCPTVILHSSSFIPYRIVSYRIVSPFISQIKPRVALLISSIHTAFSIICRDRRLNHASRSRNLPLPVLHCHDSTTKAF